MYNMYSWDQSARATDEQTDTPPTESHAARNGQASTAARNGQAHPGRNGTRNGQAHPARNGQTRAAHSGQAVPRQASAATRHAQAVQFSLDRRDNGGDPGRTR